MSNMLVNSLNSGIDDSQCNTALPTDPFTALKAHFGMLVGVADFQTIDAYHRGKQWLHSAWLHREGVVWGFGVSVHPESDEIRVAPGLAVDGLGRELHLSKTVCLNLPAWLEKHAENPDVIAAINDADDPPSLTAHVVIQFKACLGRQVPALMEPCEGGGAATAYSRILETVEVTLKPGPAPQVGDDSRERPYHRLRLLFNLVDAIEENGIVIENDQTVLDRRTTILGLAADEQPKAYLQAFREFAALDVVDMGPTQSDQGESISNLPTTDSEQLVIAEISDVAVENNSLTNGHADNRVRDSHIATATIQELLCGPLLGNAAAGSGELVSADETPAAPLAVADAGGPRIDRSTVVFDTTATNHVITVEQAGPKLLSKSLVAGESVSVMTYDINSGWSEALIENISCKKEPGNPAGRATVTITLADTTTETNTEPAEPDLLRLIIKGTGLTPALATLSATSRVPLAGELGGMPASSHDGIDFVHTINLEN